MNTDQTEAPPEAPGTALSLTPEEYHARLSALLNTDITSGWVILPDAPSAQDEQRQDPGDTTDSGLSLSRSREEQARQTAYFRSWQTERLETGLREFKASSTPLIDRLSRTDGSATSEIETKWREELAEAKKVIEADARAYQAENEELRAKSAPMA